MPSELSKRRTDHCLQVISGGQSLELSIQCPCAMTNMKYLYQKWTSTDSLFNRGSFWLLPFHSSQRRSSRSSNGPIVSAFNLKLPANVKTEISESQKSVWYLIFPSHDQEIFLYFAMEAPNADYILEEEEDPEFHSV